MRLSQFTDLGLRALMRLADSPEGLTLSDIATDVGASEAVLLPPVNCLQAARLLEAQGPHLRLARAATSIRLGEAVWALERSEPLTECFRSDGGACPLTDDCRVSAMLAEAEVAVLDRLNRYSLADCAVPAPQITPQAAPQTTTPEPCPAASGCPMARGVVPLRRA